MKKFLFTSVLILALVLSMAVYAEFDTDIWEVFDAGQSYTADFDNDGESETMCFTAYLDEWYDGSFTISVGDSSASVEYCMYLDPTVYAAKAGYTRYYYGTLFMVNEYGASDDPLTYCYLYADGELKEIGTIPSTVSALRFAGDGTITTTVRADMVGTWSRAADYVIASFTQYTDEDEWISGYRICEVPRQIYSMGMIVTLKKDLPISDSVYTLEADNVIGAGEKLILVASDDVSRLYVSSLDGVKKGWIAMKRNVIEDDYYYWEDMISVGGDYFRVDEVFDDVFYAD